MRTVRTIVVTAVVAALVSAGAAGAATLITGKQVKDGSLTGADIKNKSLTGKDIKNGSIDLAQLSPAVRAALAKAGAKGDTGAKGDSGAKGDKGETGPTGPGEVVVTKLDGSQGWTTRAGFDGQIGPEAPSASLRDGHLVLDTPEGNAYAGVKLNVPAGIHLRDVTHLVFSEKVTGGIDGYNAPYFRVFTKDANGNDHDVIYSPSTQPGGPGSTVDWRRHNVVDGTVRYDDDGGNSDAAWSAMIAAHGNDLVQSVNIQAGDSGAYSEGATALVDHVTLGASGLLLRFDFGG